MGDTKLIGKPIYVQICFAVVSFGLYLVVYWFNLSYIISLYASFSDLRVLKYLFVHAHDKIEIKMHSENDFLYNRVK